MLIIACCVVELSLIRRLLHSYLFEDLPDSADEHLQDVEEPEPTIVEMERYQRDEDFRKRITRMKEELALQSPVAKLSSDAEVLHPMVYNLPHNMIGLGQGEAPGEFEVAE